MAWFGAQLVHEGVQLSTLKSYISGIKAILKADGYCWVEDRAELHLIIRACKIENDVVKIRLPISYRLLETLLFEMQRLYSTQPYLEVLFRALFMLAYYGLMRVGELTFGQHVLKAKDIHIGCNKDKLLVVLYSSKTHGKNNLPQEIKITSMTKQAYQNNCKRRLFCPFQAIREFTAYRGCYENDNEQFFIFRGGMPVRPVHM